jgi:hypothetical protein
MYLARTKSPRKTKRNKSARYRAKIKAKNKTRQGRISADRKSTYSR